MQPNGGQLTCGQGIHVYIFDGSSLSVVAKNTHTQKKQAFIELR